jgi:hypothetical protein
MGNGSARKRSAVFPCAALALGCSHAMVRSAPGFTGAELDRQSVLLLPIAVTDDYGDERTGIVLDHESREQAARLACRSGAGFRADVRIVCFDEPSLAQSSSELVDLREGRVVRAAARRREASTSSLEAPPASQQLHAIMHDLIGDLLDRD